MQSFSIPRGQLLIEIEKTRNMSKDKFIIKICNRRNSPKFQCWGEFRRVSQVAIFDISFYLGVFQL